MKQLNQAQSANQAPSSDNKVLSRRKFLLQASAVSVPTVMSLKSGSAWGCEKLLCTPGEASLSNSGSQVASVTEGPNKVYTRPRWPTKSNIAVAFEKDFVVYLMNTYNLVSDKGLATCSSKQAPVTTDVWKKGKWVKETVLQTVYTYTPLAFDQHTIPWWSQASTWNWNHVTLLKENIQGSKPVYRVLDKKKLDVALPAMDSTNFPLYSKSSTRMPAMYKKDPMSTGQGFVVSSFTLANKFSSNLPATSVRTLINGESLASYVVAAIVGAMWERHPSYKGEFDRNNPNAGKYCFPSPQELVAAYDKVILRSQSGRPEDAKAEDDMLSLFKLYMVGS